VTKPVKTAGEIHVKEMKHYQAKGDGNEGGAGILEPVGAGTGSLEKGKKSVGPTYGAVISSFC